MPEKTERNLAPSTDEAGIISDLLTVTSMTSIGLGIYVGNPDFTMNEKAWRGICEWAQQMAIGARKRARGIGSRLEGRVREPFAMEHEVRLLFNALAEFMDDRGWPPEWSDRDVQEARILQDEARRLMRLFQFVPKAKPRLGDNGLSEPIQNSVLARLAGVNKERVSKDIQTAIRKAGRAMKKGGSGPRRFWSHDELRAAYSHLPKGKLKIFLKSAGLAPVSRPALTVARSKS